MWHTFKAVYYYISEYISAYCLAKILCLNRATIVLNWATLCSNSATFCSKLGYLLSQTGLPSATFRLWRFQIMYQKEPFVLGISKICIKNKPGTFLRWDKPQIRVAEGSPTLDNR